MQYIGSILNSLSKKKKNRSYSEWPGRSQGDGIWPLHDGHEMDPNMFSDRTWRSGAWEGLKVLSNQFHKASL